MGKILCFTFYSVSVTKIWFVGLASSLALLFVILIGAIGVIVSIFFISKQKKKYITEEISQTPPLSRNPSREISDISQKCLENLPKLQVDTPSNDYKPFFATEVKLDTQKQNTLTSTVAEATKLSDETKSLSQKSEPPMITKVSQEDTVQLSIEILPAAVNGEDSHMIQKSSETENKTLTKEDVLTDSERHLKGITFPGSVEETEAEVHVSSATGVEDVESWRKQEDDMSKKDEKIAEVTTDISNTNEEVVDQNIECARLEPGLGSPRSQEIAGMGLDMNSPKSPGTVEPDVETSPIEQENALTEACVSIISGHEIGKVETSSITSSLKQQKMERINLDVANSSIKDEDVDIKSNVEEEIIKQSETDQADQDKDWSNWSEKDQDKQSHISASQVDEHEIQPMDDTEKEQLELDDDETQTEKTMAHIIQRGKSDQANIEHKTEEKKQPIMTDQEPKDKTDQETTPKEKQREKPVKSIESGLIHRDKTEHSIPKGNSATKSKKRSPIAEQPLDDETELAPKKDKPPSKLKKLHTRESTDSSVQATRSGKKVTKKLSGHKDKRIHTAAKDAVESQPSPTSPSPGASRIQSSENYHKSHNVKTVYKKKSPTKS